MRRGSNADMLTVVADRVIAAAPNPVVPAIVSQLRLQVWFGVSLVLVLMHDVIRYQNNLDLTSNVEHCKMNG